MLTRSEFLTGAMGLAAAAVTAPAVTTSPDTTPAVTTPAGASMRRGLTYRGISYDTGDVYGGRSHWTHAQMAEEVRAIRYRLGCNTISIFGSYVDRLLDTATVAAECGLHVMLQPRLPDRPQDSFLDLLGTVGRAAGRIRGVDVILNIGCEFTLFTPGITPGRTFLDRIAYLSSGEADFAAIFRRLRAFVARAVPVARQHFDGRITYSAAEFEPIDWSLFDLVGLDYYAFHPDRAGHVRELRPYRRWRKPILICEFGCCTYRGAPRRGGDGYQAVDWLADPPHVRAGIVRSERTQADYLTTMLDTFSDLHLLGACNYTFISPDSPHRANPRFDLDTASFSVAKVIRERPYDEASPYRWEPKLAFAAIAHWNAAQR